jgi:FSR family fosmidomycin resistance protein-like MFS transporter
VTTAAKSFTQLLGFKDVWLITGGHLITHWYPATFYVLLPVIGKELGLTYTQIGLIISLQHLVGAITNLPGGMLVDAVGRKGYLMATSLFWVGFPYLLIAFLPPSYAMLLVCISLVGIGNNLWHPTAIPTLANRYPDRKGLVLSVHGMGGNLGEALAPLVIGVLLSYMSWRSALVINVLPGAVMAVLILVFLGAFAVESNRGKTSDTAKTRGGTRAYLRDVASLLHNRGLMLIACSGMFRVATQSGLLTFLPVYLAYELGYSSWAVGMAMMMLQATGFIAGPIGGHISDVVGRKKVVMASMAGTACVILGIIFAGKTPVFILIVALLGFFLYATRAVFQAWTLEQTPPHLAATGIGINFSMQGLGAAFAPFMFGYIADHYSIYTAFYFLAGLVVIANILICFMPGMSNRPAHASGNTP